MDVVAIALVVVGGFVLAVRSVRAVVAREPRRLEAALVVVGVGAALFCVNAFDQLTFIAWMQEDRPVEWATASAFVAAATLSLRRSFGVRRQHRLQAVGWGLSALAWMFVAGEEISWGQRVWGFATPEVLLRTNVQLEANVHNALTDVMLGPIPLDADFLSGVVGLALGAGGPAIAWWLYRRRAIDVRPVFARGPLQGALLMVAGLQWWHPVDYGGEVTELLLGLGALLVALGEQEAWWRRPGIATAAVATAGLVLSPVLSVSDASPERIAAARGELTALGTDIRNSMTHVVEQIVQLRHRTFHGRLQWAAVRLGVELPVDGQFLQGTVPAHLGGPSSRKGYFLDPWHTPYWIYLDFPERRMLLYSFGPNRRRDTMVHSQAQAQGDDIGVLLRWPEGTIRIELLEQVQ